MKTLTEQQTIDHAKKEIDEMIIDLKKLIYRKIEVAVNAGSVPDEFYSDNALLAKSIIDSVMRDRPYAALSNWKKDFDNIHKFL